MVLLGLFAIASTGTGIVLRSYERITVSTQAKYGAGPALLAPNPSLIPTVNIALAVGWQDGSTPHAARGLTVKEFASGFDYHWWLHVLVNGEVLVAESNAPAQHDAGSGLKCWVTGLIMARAEAGMPRADRISMLRDADDDARSHPGTGAAFLAQRHLPG
jgi:glucose/arabinose dehydrogenase